MKNIMHKGLKVKLRDKELASNNIDWEWGIIASHPSDYVMPEYEIELPDGRRITEYAEYLEMHPDQD